MSSFGGFPPRTRFTPVPNIFFSQLLPQIDDIAELKVTLHLFWALYRKKGYPKFVTYEELLGDTTLMTGLGDEQGLRQGLHKSISRGTTVRLSLERDGKMEDLYFLNTEEDRTAIAKILNGEIPLGKWPRVQTYGPMKKQPNIFTLYEENIGMLTPMIAEELKEAERLYPASWIEDAFREAVSRNKRSWKYIETILKRWADEGRGHGEPGRDSKEDRDKYIKGRYGHVVKR